MPSIHPDISDRLLSYLDRRLDEHDRRQVQEHLSSCGACSEELAAMRAITVALRQAGRDSRSAYAAADRYGCPGPEDLSSYEARGASHATGEGNWIENHLEGCPRCQHEVDLIHLSRQELQDATTPLVPGDLSAKVEALLLARVRQGKGTDPRASLLDRFPSLSARFVARAALGLGLAAAVGVWGFLYLRSDPVLVAHRPSKQEEGPVTPSVAPPSASQRELQIPLRSKRVSPPPVSEPVSPRISSPTPTVVARVEPPAPPSRPSPSVVARVEPAAPPASAVPSVTVTPPVAEQAREVPVRPLTQPSLPSLVPAKQREALKILILPTPTRPALRSMVASELRDQLEAVQPPVRDFPADPSVDDLTANRRLGRLFGVRYVLEVGIRKEASRYHLILRAADTDTGGVVAKREGLASEESEVAAVARQLARELRQQLKAMP